MVDYLGGIVKPSVSKCQSSSRDKPFTLSLTESNVFPYPLNLTFRTKNYSND